MKVLLQNWSLQALLAAILTLGLLMASYVVVEPTVSRAVDDQFIVTQSITAEISFTNIANDITMSPSIPGLTGGTANGQTQVVVTTNNASGYNMTIDFASSSDPDHAMQGNQNGGEILNYTPAVVGTPDFTHSVGANTGEFAYTVSASTTSDIDTTFRNNGSVCNNASGGDTAASCWYNPSTTAETIINRSTATSDSGATTTIHFRVQLTSNPSPVIPIDTYTATATLTAVTN